MMTSMIRLRLCLGFAAAVLAAALPVAANAATAVTTSNVNLREGPSTDYPVIMTLPASAAVDVEGCAQGWCKVAYSGTEGWMSEGFLQGLSSPPTIVLPVPIVVPRHHYGYRPPYYRPPVVVPHPPHRPPHRPPHGGPPPQAAGNPSPAAAPSAKRRQPRTSSAAEWRQTGRWQAGRRQARRVKTQN
jgi:uncharacterized protein YraI